MVQKIVDLLGDHNSIRQARANAANLRRKMGLSSGGIGGGGFAYAGHGSESSAGYSGSSGSHMGGYRDAAPAPAPTRSPRSSRDAAVTKQKAVEREKAEQAKAKKKQKEAKKAAKKAKKVRRVCQGQDRSGTFMHKH